MSEGQADALDRIVKAFEKRLNIYRAKHAAANPLGEDIYNRFDTIQYVIEAIELLAFEAGINGHLKAREG
ncbi:hypothetical protein ACFSTI_25080 [Rhizorhabdus histidinilytica]|uniref:Uncharacterized protein n=1 Tax=Rhizorhabdus histidinilytica TaxID=439228 RepID=A0A1T5A7X8_9SPHN|nr:hypothetical protein [Rhizorhabdus histidinilytica]SKB31020.1 hypothetical protein SAMN06295920_101682 [Rhizorhabdus histidinilytica]